MRQCRDDPLPSPAHVSSSLALPPPTVLEERDDCDQKERDLRKAELNNIVPFLPGLMPNILAEEDVSLSRLSMVLESAFMEHEEDQDRLYVTEGLDCPVWIDLTQDQSLLTFFTYWPISDEPDADWVKRANELNSTVILVQFCFSRSRIWGAYWMTYAGGLNIRQFIKMLRLFSNAFVGKFIDSEFFRRSFERAAKSV